MSRWMVCAKSPPRYAKIKLTALIWACLGAGLSGAPVQAQTDIFNLTTTERAAFQAEIRAVLRDTPEITAGVRAPTLTTPAPVSPIADAYAQAVADDLALIESYSSTLFDQAGYGAKDAAVVIALFTSPDCALCATALTDLRNLTATHDLRITVIDIKAEADMAHALGLEGVPSYVLPNMMIRGQMPSIVLSRYIKALENADP